MATWIYITGGILLLLLVTLSALFSFSEMAISSANKARLSSIADNKSGKAKNKRQAKRVIHFMDNYNEHISAIVIFNNIVNILFSTLATIYFVAIFGEIGALVSFLVTTPIVIIFGEIVPKQLAKKYPEKGTMRLSWTLQIVNMIMKPFTFILSKIIKEEESVMLGSDKEIEHALREATDRGVTTSFEAELIKKSLAIDNKTLRDVMIPFDEASVITGNLTETKINNLIKKNPHSRFPVLDKEGNVQSIFSAKRYLVDSLVGKTLPLEEYLFEFATLNDDDNPYHAFELLRNRRERMALVIDEDDNNIGIITIEDIIELMLGNIYDEDDHEEDGVYTLSETSFIVEGNVKLSYLKDSYIKTLKLDDDQLKLTMKKFVEILSGKKVKEGDHFTYKNIIIWAIKDNVKDAEIIYEIDVV